jgi:hypothetical protein
MDMDFSLEEVIARRYHRQMDTDDHRFHHRKGSGDHRFRHQKGSDHRYCSGVGRSCCSWGRTSFLIDLPYITRPQDAKQAAKLCLLKKFRATAHALEHLFA